MSLSINSVTTGNFGDYINADGGGGWGGSQIDFSGPRLFANSTLIISWPQDKILPPKFLSSITPFHSCSHGPTSLLQSLDLIMTVRQESVRVMRAGRYQKTRIPVPASTLAELLASCCVRPDELFYFISAGFHFLTCMIILGRVKMALYWFEKHSGAPQKSGSYFKDKIIWSPYSSFILSFASPSHFVTGNILCTNMYNLVF